MDSAQQDMIDLVEHAGRRLTDRMTGLTDDEWAWQPVPGDPEVTIRWRLDHVVDTLTDARNRTWLGLGPSARPAPRPAASAAAARTALEDAVQALIDDARELGDAASGTLGEVAGPYGAATRRSFVLYLADELIHHGAEAALLRDLAAVR